MFLGVVVAGAAVVPAEAGERPAVTVISTSGIRGDIRPGGHSKSERGGIDRLATLLAGRREKGPILLLDAGDFSPRPGWTDSLDAFTWSLMGDLGYDVATPGDAELRLGFQGLRNLMNGDHRIRVVSANVRREDGKLVFPESIVIRRGGLRIGVTGVTDTLYHAFNRTRGLIPVDDLELDPVVESLQRVVRKLRRRADVVIVLLHLNGKAGPDLVRQVPGIDLAVVGHNAGKINEMAGTARVLGPGTRLQLVGETPISPRGIVGPPARIRLGEEFSRDSGVESRILGFQSRVQQREERDAWIERLNEPRRHHLERAVFTDWVFSPWRRDGDPVEIRIPGFRLEYRLRWMGRFAPSPFPLRRWLREAPPTRPVGCVLVTDAGDRTPIPTPPGSPAEGEVCALLRIYAEMQLGERPESLLHRFLTEGPGRVFPDLRDSQRNGLLALALASALERQAKTMEAPVWVRRAMVYLDLVVSPDGTVLDATVIENHDTASTADSLIQAVKAWRFPPRAAEKTSDRPGRVLAAIPMDRGEFRLDEARKERRPELAPDLVPPPGERLPEYVRRALTEDDFLSSWTRIWSRDPGFSLDDFISLDGEDVAVNRDRRSPFAEPDIRIHCRREIAPGILVLVGTSWIKHPRFRDGTWGHLQVPTVWLGGGAEGRVRRFQGVPVPAPLRLDINRALTEAGFPAP